jgi:transcriptional regulator with XRE-family HTH domain
MTAVLSALGSSEVLIAEAQLRLEVRPKTPRMPPDGEMCAPRSGSLLTALRKRRGRTLTETARAIGVAHTTLLRWERGESSPDNTRLHSLCFFLQASTDEVSLLTTGVYTEEISTEDYWESLLLRYNSLVFPGGPLSDLGLAALETELWAKAQSDRQDAPYRPLLVNTLARHAMLLHLQKREPEAQRQAERALRLARIWVWEPGAAAHWEMSELWGETVHQSESWPVALLTLAQIDARKGDISRALTHLEVCRRDRLSPAFAAWFQSQKGAFLARIGETDSAACLLREALCIAEERTTSPGEIWFRRLDLAELLCRTGLPSEALQTLKPLENPTHHPRPLARTRFSLLRAAVLAELDVPGDAAADLQSARNALPDVAPHHQLSLKSQLAAVERRIDRASRRFVIHPSPRPR